MTVSEEIKSKLDIVDVIREYIPSLKPVGVNFVALSPFKHEKHASFIVSPEKQIWHCFSTGKGGDIFTFLMEIEGISFIEALRLLARKAGVVLRKENPAEQSQKNKLLDIMEETVNFYHQNLMANEAVWARDYLEKRGLKKETIMEWQIGVSPENWTGLLEFLKKKGFLEKDMLLAGLVIKKEGKNTFFDRFRGRIMFPIFDINGSPVAFSARMNPQKEEIEKMGKYINSPETPLYSKSKILFGLDKAKRIIKEKDFAIAVEGQMDAITAHQAGFKNTVAVSGTALTYEQLKLLKRYSDNIALAFDMDAAGQMAADRGIEETMAIEMNIKIITLPDGKDPDELIKKDPKLWKRSVDEAKHIMDYYFEKIFKALDLEKIEDKRKAVKILLPIINRFKNKVEQDFWIKKLSQKIDTNEFELREELAKTQPSARERLKKEPEEKEEEAPKRQGREEMLSENLMVLAIRFPLFLDYISGRLGIDHIFGKENKLFYKNLIIYYNNNTSNSVFRQDKNEFKIDYKDFGGWLKTQEDNISDNQLKLLDKLVVLGDRDFFELESEKAKNEIIRIEIALKDAYFSARRKEMEKLIAREEKEGNMEEVKKLMEELKCFIDEAEKNSAESEQF